VVGVPVLSSTQSPSLEEDDRRDSNDRKRQQGFERQRPAGQRPGQEKGDECQEPNENH
jgi:hypothetical protein